MQLLATKKDYIWSYIGTFFRMGSSFLLLPFLLLFLGDKELGLWYVFLAIASFVTLFQAGFVPSFSRNIVYCWSGVQSLSKEGLCKTPDNRGDVSPTLFCNLIEASRRIYRLIALVTFVLLAIFGTQYIISVASEMDYSEYLAAWSVFCCGVFFNLYFSYYESLLRGVGNFPGTNKAMIASSFVQVALDAVLLAFGLGIMACSIGYFIQGLIFRLLCRHYFYSMKSVSELVNDGGRDVNSQEIKDIISIVSHNAIRDTVVSFSNYAVTTANTLICSLVTSLTTTGTYSILLQLTSAVASLATVVLTTNQPALQSAFACGDSELEKKITSSTVFAFVLIYCLGIALVAIVVIPLMQLIRPSFSCDWILFVIMTVYIFLWRQHSMCATFLTNTNKLPYVRAFVISAFIGVLLTLLMAVFTDLGLYSLVLGQGLSQIVYNNWKWPHVAAGRFGCSYFSLLKCGMVQALSGIRSRLN